MALKMPGPTPRSSGVYQLNVRVPADLLSVVAGTQITLPLGPDLKVVTASDKVMLSLRTKDRREARERYTIARSALLGHFNSLRGRPAVPSSHQAVDAETSNDGVGSIRASAGAAVAVGGSAAKMRLTHKQEVALAGDVYRKLFDDGEDEFDYETFSRAAAVHEEHVQSWIHGEAGDGKIAREDAEELALLADGYGAQMMAWQRRGDVKHWCLAETMTFESALEDLFGGWATRICARHNLDLEPEARLKLLARIADAVELGTARVRRRADGDYGPDENMTRFPTFGDATKITVAVLFARWKDLNKGNVAASTIRRYTPSLNSLAKFVGDKDVRRISQADIFDWAEHRRDHEGVASSTVNRNDLVAASAIFAFASSKDTRKNLRADNPVKDVKLKVPKKNRTRIPLFKPSEVSKILTLARDAKPRRGYAKAGSSRRWVPWLCAYSGARVQEPLWLEKKHIQRDEETGIWVMKFPKTKTSNPRTVPLHDSLIEEGFLDFVAKAPDGLLFVGDKMPKAENEERTIQEYRASSLATWIQDNLDLEAGVDPNHGWRHTFITRATGKMDKRFANAICGHNEKQDVSDGYFTASVEEMKTALDSFPRYTVLSRSADGLR
jgi:integrase